LTHVLLDARLTRQMSVGMKQYVSELTARLPRVAPEFEYVTFAKGGNFGWNEQVALPAAIARCRPDLVHFMSIYTPLIVPAPSIVTVHDLIHLAFPQFFKSKVGPYYHTVVRRACARAARVITDDERTVDDLERFLGVDPRKVRAIPLGVDVEQWVNGASLRHPERSGRSYFLYVGNHREHKDLQTLLDAWHALPPEYDVDVLLTGPDDFDGALQRASTARRHAAAVGDVGREELAALYRGADALVHPALREGFGLPILEAMAAGTPVVACADAVPRAMARAALLFPPRDVGTLTLSLMRILSDQGLRERLVNEGRVIAGELTWDRCARATAGVYHEVAG
jgi:glycosyltransferase involved in cell wall biosynthesis